jgi:F-type H+-transporting ATPase subunit delta
VDPDLVGGVVIRIGDRILDGSVRRRVSDLRRRLLRVSLPQREPVNFE